MEAFSLKSLTVTQRLIRKPFIPAITSNHRQALPQSRTLGRVRILKNRARSQTSVEVTVAVAVAAAVATVGVQHTQGRRQAPAVMLVDGPSREHQQWRMPASSHCCRGLRVAGTFWRSRLKIGAASPILLRDGLS